MEAALLIKTNEGEVSTSQLSTLISILQSSKKINKGSSVREIQSALLVEFDAIVTEDALFNLFFLAIDTEDRELIYKNAGF